MNAVVSEPGVTLDTRLLGQNVVVLPLEEANNLRETGGTELAPKQIQMVFPGFGVAPSLIVDLVAEAWGIHNRQGDAGSLLIQLELCSSSQIPIA